MRNALYEQALTKCGVEFEYLEEVRLDEINHTRGKQLQARLEPVPPDLVDSYRQMRADGFEPPPLLLWKPGRGLWVPLDGNCRIEACLTSPKKHQSPFSAYAVKTEDPMVADRLCWQFNNMVNGRRLSYAEALAHALSFCRKYDQPSGQVAKDWGVKDWELRIKLVEAELRDKAASKRVDLDGMPTFTVTALQPVAMLDEGAFVKLAKAVKESGIGVDPVKKAVAEMGKAKTVEKKLAVIDEFIDSDAMKQARAETKGGKVRHKTNRLPKVRLKKQLEALSDLLAEFEDEAFKPTKLERKDTADTARFVVNRLIAVYGLGAFVKGGE